MSRVFNFCAGPAALPETVLERAGKELANWHEKGLSIMEMSHRSKDYVGVAEKAEQDLRDLMNIPDNYKVLFMQGGASSQFTMVPMNLLRGGNKADYINTGQWSIKAIAEAAIVACEQCHEHCNKHDDAHCKRCATMCEEMIADVKKALTEMG